MPYFNILKSFVVVIVGALLGYNGLHFFYLDKNNTRALASLPMSKISKDQSSQYLFEIILNTDELAQNNSDISVLKIKIQALKNFNSGLTYIWNLPQDIDVVEGYLTGPLEAFNANEEKEFILKVRNFSKQSKKFISFEVLGLLNEKNVRREVLISSRVEDSFEYTIQQNELNNRKNQNNKLDIRKSKFDPENVVK